MVPSWRDQARGNSGSRDDRLTFSCQCHLGEQLPSFGHPGYSVFIAQFGLPNSYLEALLDYLSEEIGTSVRLSDFVQPSLREGWEPRIHIQNNEAWQQEDETEWSKINI
jgi:hypothetical protein